MTGPAFPWIELIGIIVLGVSLLLFVGGIALFILGMVRRRRGLWIAGIVMAIPGLTLLAGAAVWFLWASDPIQTSKPMLAGGTAQVSARRYVIIPGISTTDELDAWFRDTAGIELPEGVQLVDADVTSRSAGGQMPDIFTSSVMKVTVGESFGSFLSENFQKAAMEDVKDRMRAGEAEEPAFFRDGADLRMEYFTRRCSGSVRLAVAHDPYKSAAYLVRTYPGRTSYESSLFSTAPAGVDDPAQKE